MAIIASCCSFIHMNDKKFNKKSFDEILGLSFDLRHSKVNIYYVRRSEFCKGLLKGLI